MSTPNLPQKQPQSNDIQGVVKMLTTNKDALQIALGKAVPVDYFNRVALTSIRKSPLLAACTPQSLMSELMTLAQLRLVLDTVLGEAYLVPFFNSKIQKYEATLMVGYKGYVKLVRRNQKVVNVTAEVVYEKDEFRMQKGSNRLLHHVPYIKDENRGAWLGAYAFIAYEGGAEDFEFVPADYIERVKASSPGSDKPDSPWQLWPEPQWKKTAVKQLMKLADLSPEVREALEKDLDTGAIDIQATVASGGAEASKLVAQRQQAKLPAPEVRETLNLRQEEPQRESVPTPTPPPEAAPKKKVAATPPTPPPPPPKVDQDTEETQQPMEGHLPFNDVDPFVDPVTEADSDPVIVDPEPEPEPEPAPKPKAAAAKPAPTPAKTVSPQELAAQFRARLEQHKKSQSKPAETEDMFPE